MSKNRIIDVLLILCLLLISLNVWAAPVTIRFWHVWEGESRLSLINEQVSDFEECYSNIKVQHTFIDQRALHQKYLTAILSGDPPDVIMLRGGDMPSYADRNAIIPLNKYIEKDGLDPDKIFYEAEIATHRYNGTNYSLPMVTGGALFLLFYNKDIFSEAGLDPEKPPKTWQELEEYSKKLTIIKDGRIERLGFNPTAGGSYPPSTPFLSWLYTNNGQFMDLETKEILFDSKEGLETLEWLLGFVKNISGKYENIRFLAGGDKFTNRLAFYNGKQAIVNEGNYFFYQLEQEAPHINYGVFELPYNGKNLEATNYTPTEGGWGYAITAGSKHHDEAWKWLRFITVEKAAEGFIRAQKRPSPVRIYNEAPDLTLDNPYWPVMLQALENTKPMAITTAQMKIKEILNTMEENVLYEKQTPAEALKWAAKEVEKELAELEK